MLVKTTYEVDDRVLIKLHIVSTETCEHCGASKSIHHLDEENLVPATVKEVFFYYEAGEVDEEEYKVVLDSGEETYAKIEQLTPLKD
jgi:hypothetical protein